MAGPTGGRFSSLLLEGLDEYRRGNMAAAVRAWEEAYTLEPTNPRAREFLHSALERIYAQMGLQKKMPDSQPARTPTPVPSTLRLHVPARGRPEKPPPPLEPNDAQIQLRGAQDLMSQRDFEGALELLSKVQEREPGSTAVARLREQCEAELTRTFEARLGSLAQRPRVLLKPDEIRWLDLDPRAGFILAQIDGSLSYEDLYDVCGLPRLDTVRILAQLVAEKVIGQVGQ